MGLVFVGLYNITSSEQFKIVYINLGISLSVLENDLYIGSAVGKFPILVPPGRGGLSPNILLDYSSYRGNGWIGVGWDFNMGAIQRSTKKGVKYDANDYLSVMNLAGNTPPWHCLPTAAAGGRSSLPFKPFA